MNPVLLPTDSIGIQAYIHHSRLGGEVVLEGWSIGVVIPARNEESTVSFVLESLPNWVDFAVVIDDGSTDGTREKATNSKSPCPSTVLDGGGQGVGASIDMGHQYLLEHLPSPFVSVVVAGDGQMNPNDMKGLIQPLLKRTADHVKGNRQRHHAGFNQMPAHRKVASRVLAFFTTLAAGRRIGDPQCGYTATTDTLLRQWDWHRSWPGYGYPNYWAIRLSAGGWRTVEAPVESVYRNETSGIRRGSFFMRVGVMMAIEHHRRNIAWLHPGKLSFATAGALFFYLLGWTLMMAGPPTSSPAFESASLMTRSALGLLCWGIAHLFDRRAVRFHQEKRLHAASRSTQQSATSSRPPHIGAKQT